MSGSAPSALPSPRGPHPAAVSRGGAAPSRSLARVARGDLCAGCGGCAALAPGAVEMTVAPPGYLRPRQTGPVSAEQDAAIARICPGLTQIVEAAGRIDDPLWGPYLEMRSGHAADAALRHAGASGGALSMLALHLLESGRVEAVLATAADPDLPIGNAAVELRDRDGILAAAGSRYAPSAPLADLRARLAAAPDDRFAVICKPCDAAALRALIAEEPGLAPRIPVILSFFCAGVPSHAGGRAVLEALGTALERTAAFRFRGMGWPGRATARDLSGTERSMSYHDSWGGILSRHVQHRCKICPDGTGTAADLVCADAWESDERGYPVFEEGEGTSLIVARTETGRAILEAAVAAGRVETRPFDPAALAAIQPGQRERRRALLARLAGLALAGRPVPRYRGLRLTAAARQNTPARHLRNFLGMLRRARRIGRAPRN